MSPHSISAYRCRCLHVVMTKPMRLPVAYFIGGPGVGLTVGAVSLFMLRGC